MLGCTNMDKTPPSDTRTTNLIRKRLGIRPISKDWDFYVREFACEKWSKNGRLVKIVNRTDEENGLGISTEQDYYYGTGRLSDGDDVSAQEQVSIVYDYVSANFYVSYIGTNPAALRIISGMSSSDLGWYSSSNSTTLKEADKLLGLIGKSRLNKKKQKEQAHPRNGGGAN
jgi:hypothetical protein